MSAGVVREATSFVTVARRQAASTSARRYGILSFPGICHTAPFPRLVSWPLSVIRTSGASWMALTSLRQIASVYTVRIWSKVRRSINLFDIADMAWGLPDPAC